MATPPLGWISPADRTRDQEDAHHRAMAALPRFALPPVSPTIGPVKVVLTDFWKDSDAVQDLGGKPFTGFHQLTGACVGCSAGNAIATLAMIQRKLSDNPTKAFIPWWPFPYGRTRANEGDRGQGEGAVDSVMGQTLHAEGVFDIGQSGLPTFDTSDGYTLTQSLEMQWSDGNSSTVTKWQGVAKQHVLGSVAPVNTTQDIKAAILSGCPVLDGCDYYVGNGSIVSGGGTPYVVGQYDGRGGHSTCILGFYDHPNDGPLYLYSNQWPSSTYPKDPAGGGRCCVWLTEATMAKLFQNGGSGGESMALAHQDWTPAQVDKLLDWATV